MSPRLLIKLLAILFHYYLYTIDIKKKILINYTRQIKLYKRQRKNSLNKQSWPSLTGATFGGTKLSISFLVMRPSGPDPEWKQNKSTMITLFFVITSKLPTVSSVSLGYLPLTCARSIPFSAASFLANGLANTRPFLGAAGAAAAAGAALGTGACNKHPETKPDISQFLQQSG